MQVASESRFAWSQAYPSRPVRLMVPLAPGGATDIIARPIGQWLSERLGQPFIIENRPGSGTNIGTEAVVRAASEPALALCLPEESPARHGWDHIITIITAIHRGGATHPPEDPAENLQLLKACCASLPTEGARQVVPS